MDEMRVVSVMGLVAVLAASACEAGGQPAILPPIVVGADPQPSLASLVGSEWLASTIRGQPVLPETQITLELGEGNAGGYAGCNWWGGPLVARGDSVDFGDIMLTARGCTRPGVMEQEMRFIEQLGLAAIYRLDGDTLRFAGRAGEELISLLRRHPLAMNPAELVGSRWVLEKLGTRTLQAPRPITLVFDRSTISGFGGCRDYRGDYAATGDRINFPSLTMLSTECPDQRLSFQEGDFMTGLSESVHYRLNADRLELYTVGGDTVTFTPN
jgi:heat shock protein HslJ